MRKVLSIVLVLATLLGLCGVAFAADTPVTLKVMIYERGNTTAAYGTATDNYWTRWVQEHFGDPNGIKVEYVPVPRAQDNEKINTMMASGSAPDIIFSYDSTMMMDFGKKGGLTELSALVDEYGPNLKANLADTFEYGNLDGNQWAIVAKRSRVGRYGTYIRKDWLDQMNYTLAVNDDGFYHMSVDDFTDVLRQAKTLDLDKTGMEIYPLGMMGAYDATQARPIIYAFINRAELTDEMRACYDTDKSQLLWPGYKDGVRYLNQLYNEGLIDPDFMVDTDTSYPAFSSLLSNGRILAFGQDVGYGFNGGLEAFYESHPDGEFVMVQLDNVHGEQFVDVYAPTGMYITVPATCKNPEAAVKYLDFLADYDNAKTLIYGLEGQRWQMVDGVPTLIPHTEEEKAAIEGYEITTLGDMMLVYNGNPFGYAEPTEGLAPAQAAVQKLANVGYEISKVGGSAPYNFKGIKTAATEEYEGFLVNMTKSLPSLITCPADQFDTLYDQAVQTYLTTGGQKVIDAQIELYKELEAAQ